MHCDRRVVPIRPGETACLECAFHGRCLARTEDGGAGKDIAISPRVMHRGDHIFRTNEEFHNVYTVRSGAIKTYVILQSGEEQVIGFHTPGDVVGLDAIDSGRYTCNAMVLDTSCICPLPFEQLCRAGTKSPTMQNRLMRSLSRRIVDHEGLLLILGQKTADQRMAAFLLHISRQQQRLGLSGVDIHLPMSRADIASYLALAVETVSRVLTRLQENGVLDVQRNQIHVLDLDKLANLAEETLEDAPPKASARRRQ